MAVSSLPAKGVLPQGREGALEKVLEPTVPEEAHLGSGQHPRERGRKKKRGKLHPSRRGRTTDGLSDGHLFPTLLQKKFLYQQKY